MAFILSIIFFIYPFFSTDDDNRQKTSVKQTNVLSNFIKCYDSIIISEAKEFYKSLNSKSLFGLTKPYSYSQDSDIKYKGKLIKDSNGYITGEMRFSHKESANIFALKNDGSIYPSDGDTQIVNGIEFIWIPTGHKSFKSQ